MTRYLMRNLGDTILKDGAAEKTRTSTGLRPQRPQRCASTNSATAAHLLEASAGYTPRCCDCEAPNARYMHDMTLFPPVAWAISAEPVAYAEAVDAMTARAKAIRAGEAGELVWLLEHPPLYTAGTSAKPEDLQSPARFPVIQTGRGGQYTYHGPGQRVAYVMLDVAERGRDVRQFVQNLERWIVQALDQFNIEAGARDGRVGVWVDRTRPGGELREDKIAAIGVRLKRWVSFHGISVNVEPDLEHFSGIVPCGIADPRYGVTSLHDLGRIILMEEVDLALRSAFETVFACDTFRADPPV